jgi:hypothetical protein
MEQANNPSSWTNGAYIPPVTAPNGQVISPSDPNYGAYKAQQAAGGNNTPAPTAPVAPVVTPAPVVPVTPAPVTTPVNTASSDAAGARKTLDEQRIADMQANDTLVAKNYKDMLDSQTAATERDYAQRQAEAEASFKEQEGTQKALSFRLGTEGTLYNVADVAKQNTAKQTFLNNLIAEKADKIAALTQAYKDNDYKRIEALNKDIYDLKTQQDNFLQTERQNQMSDAKDLLEKSKPLEVGGEMYKWDEEKKTYVKTGQVAKQLNQTEAVQDYEAYKSGEYEAGKSPMSFGDWYSKYHSPSAAKDPMDELLTTAELEKFASSGTNLKYGTTRKEAAALGLSVVIPKSFSENTPEYSAMLADKSPEAQQLFNGLDDEKKANVMSLITGEALLSDIAKGMGGAKNASELNSLAQRIDPSYTETANKQRYSFKIKWNDTNGKSYQVRTGANTSLQHLAQLKTIADQLSNNSDFKKWNTIGQAIDKNINGPYAEQIMAFQDTVDMLAFEIARTMKGGVPDKEGIAEERTKLLAASPTNITTALINNKVKLMTGKLASEADEYKKVMNNYPEPIVDDSTLAELRASGVDTKYVEEKLNKQSPKGSTGGTPQFNSADGWGDAFQGL